MTDVDPVSEFRHLWEAPTDRYVLLRIGGDDEHLLIIDPRGPAVELICDDDAALLVTQRMKAAGFAVIDELPPSGS